MIGCTELLEALPVAVYMTDTEGRITFYNEAAVELWGIRPEMGSSKWCGSWRLYWSDGRSMPHDECPMAIALKEGRSVRGFEAIAERPDGSRVPFVPYPTPLFDASGRMTGAFNLLVDTSERKRGEIEAARLAAIVSSSDDAIISKTLDGRVTSWNAGASRIFGYEAEEVIGRSIKLIIPPDLHTEEDEILARLNRGERIEHYETVRVAKDGSKLDISLTVSPLRDAGGNIVGASKVARNITERKRHEELRRLLFEELNHRVKNTLATVQAVASQSLRRAASPRDFVEGFTGRVQALARAHDLLVREELRGADIAEIVREQVALGAADGSTRVSASGPFVMLDARMAVQLALVLHELSTNARKYGALSVPTGVLTITWDVHATAERELFLVWSETGVPAVQAPTTRGFGTTLIERTLEGSGGQAAIRYNADGVVCDLRLPLPEGSGQAAVRRPEVQDDQRRPRLIESVAPSHLEGARILLVEDEPLVAMEIEADLAALGCRVVAATTIRRAEQIIKGESLDAALLDCDLAGYPVDELAALLTQVGVPFAFATGYGRDGLPSGFRGTDVLPKPFNTSELERALKRLLERSASTDANVATIRRGWS